MMVRHYTPESLEQLLLEQLSEEVLAQAVQHLRHCDRCWTAAAEVIHKLPSARRIHQGGARSMLLSLLQDEARSAIGELKAKAWWAELKELPPSDQLKRLRSVASLQSVSLYEKMISEAWTLGPSDPHVGEQTANLAFSLAGLLPDHQVPRRMKRDLEGEALTVVANCRRLLADWSGSFQAIRAAEQHLSEGSADPSRAAMLSSIHAFLLTDTGNFEAALGYSAKALELYRQIKDWPAVARTAIIEANTLLAAGNAGEAIEKANLALGLIGTQEPRLELLSRGVISESYLVLGRPDEALHIFSGARQLFERSWDGNTRLRVNFLEARLLDGKGCVREAEKLFSAVYQGFMDHDLYKDAFITLLTLFESRCKRGALDKAAQLCQDAIKSLKHLQDAVNPQMQDVWLSLLKVIQLGQLREADLANARQFFVRYWNTRPADRSADSLPLKQLPTALQISPIPPPPPPPKAVQPRDYRDAREAYDRTLVASALRETQGNLSEASRRLGLSRMTLRARLRRYGLTPTGEPDLKE